MITLREAVRRALGGTAPTALAAASEDRISWETVQSVTGMNECVVLGHTLPVTGLAAFPVGARVPVAWKSGRPVAVIGHRTRRAQFHPSRRVDAKGIVEELLVGNFDNTAVGIWYRTHDRLEAITDQDGTPLRAFPMGAAPSAVQWGLDGKSFAVQCTNGVYAIYTLDRDDPNTVVPDSPGLARLLWSGTPLESTTPLTTVQFVNRLTRTFRLWIGRFFLWIAYRAQQMSQYQGGWWYWSAYWDRVEEGWETGMAGAGSASASTTKAFPLTQILTTGITDWYGNNRCRGQVLEWFLDADRHLKFVITVDWDYFYVGTNQVGTGSLHVPIGAGPYGMDGYDQPLSVGGMALDVIGAKRKSDQQIVPETHLFLWDGVTESVAWATAAAAPSVGHETRQFWGRILEHHVTHDPGYSELGLPNPHQPGWEKEPSATEIYYAGANWGQPQTTYAQDDLACGDERATVVSSTGTYQLFDPARLACITGPFVAVGEGTSPYTTTLIGGYQAFYRVNFSTRTGTTQRLWHYRMQSAKVFTRRYVAGGVNPLATGIDEALLFLVVERYPYISGTGYINDLPQIWVGITTVQGQTVRVLRDWQYGLAGAALITGNGHRLFWSCGIGAIQPVTRYLYTDLDAGVEMTLASAQALLVLASKRHLLPPDFCWERLEPQGFHAIDRLPALEADELLAEYGALLGTEGAPEGSVRVVNDEEILSPLERYQTS